MSATMSTMGTKQYRPSSRSWIKLWVNEWLTGTVRWQLTPQQRSIWADLLALAGRSRFPGVVCSGETNGVLDPFPMDYLCSVFRCSEPDVRDAFHLFVGQSRITINDAGVIHIVNWDKYQSEYQLKRQRRQYNEAKRPDGALNVRTKSRKTPPQEVEVEGDKEVEAEVLAAAFSTMHCEPFGPKKFQNIWAQEWHAPGSPSYADAMERAIQRCEKAKVKVPGRFFAHKREIEKVEAEQSYKMVRP